MALSINVKKSLRSGGRCFELCASFQAQSRSIVLFGPSGSGKTLTLRAVAGLMNPDEGRIELDGRVLYDSAAGLNLPARQRGVGLVFQDYALFPHLTVFQNVGFGLRRGLTSGGLFSGGLFSGGLDAKGRARVDELLDMAGLSALARVKPGKLSGGQRQRVALLRALAPRPQALLLDEPFSALDPLLRSRMRTEVRAMCAAQDTPTLLITHDPDDVAEFGGTVALYDQGGVRRVADFADGPEGGAGARELVLSERFAAYG